MRHKNFLFANGIDFVYEFFHFESKFQNPLLSKSVQFLGKNKNLNKFYKICRHWIKYLNLLQGRVVKLIKSISSKNFSDLCFSNF